MTKNSTTRSSRKPVSAESMRLRLAGLCARSEQCEYDLRLKMARAGLKTDEADSIIDFLREQRFLDDGRYVRAFVRDKITFSGWGPAKIRATLAAKRLPRAIVDEALEEAESEEMGKSLMRAARAKARSLDLTTREDMVKLLRHLMSRGVSYSDSRRAAERLREEEQEEEEEE